MIDSYKEKVKEFKQKKICNKMDKHFNLFGNEEIFIRPSKKKPKTMFDDYEGFVDKFKAKKTTDDCFTPQPVYDCVVRYVQQHIDLTGRRIVRPFYPGGDYEYVDYPDGCVVIDNPPFSIISKIARFYVANNIDFFLFAPHLTLFSSDIDLTAIVCGADIEYENGAKVKTSFLSNLFGSLRVMGAPDLYRDLEAINASKKTKFPKYVYPPEVLTVSMVYSIVERGGEFRVDKSELKHINGLDSQKKYKKGLFGCGFLMSEKAAAEKAAAEKAAAEKAVKEEAIVWELSSKEKEIIKKLG